MELLAVPKWVHLQSQSHLEPHLEVSSLMIYLMYLRNSKFYLFADDTNIYCESSDLSNLIKIVNRELRSVKNGLMPIYHVN